jgi:hypothetical protein
MNWQPISTRPKDDLITYLVTNGRQVAPWIRGVIHNNAGTAWDWDYGSSIVAWMPLPDPPASGLETPAVPCIWRAGCDKKANCKEAGCCLGVRSNRGEPG